jgi:hypothetical protein
MKQALSLQHRIDALKRRCSTGYGCGSSCISLRKECRIRPASAIGKERLKRLLALAAGGASSQRGIAPVKASEAGEMAAAIAARRGQQAGQLRGARLLAASEKAKVAEAAQAAQVRQPGTSSATSSKPPAGSPRAKAETMEGSGEYEFARRSSVQNAGEDIANSARHKRNAFRTIEEAEESGQVERLLTRDNLLKNFPTDLISGVNEQNVITRLEGHYCLRAFPNLSSKDVANYAAAAEIRRLRGETKYGAGTALSRDFEESDAKTIRKQYFDSFQRVRQYVEANRDTAPGALREGLRREARKMIDELRKTQGAGYAATHADPYNPVANIMIDLHNRLRTGGKATVYGQMNEFVKALKEAGKLDNGDARGTMSRAIEPAIKIMEGQSLAKAFGQDGNGKWRFNAAERYVGQPRREGGRTVGGSPEAATDTIVKGLGFRGLQYGNSVTDDERRHHVQKAAEALVDLADAIGLPDKAIGLNGTLGLAIGARGRGGAVAHYEPDLKVINLTRKNGVGSLSHEWGHALDNYAAGGTSLRRGAAFLSEHAGTPETREAMGNLLVAWSTSGYTRQCFDTIREIKKAGGMISDGYWMSNVEMFARSFEAHVSLKLAKAGRSNTYLTRDLHDGGMNKGDRPQSKGDGLWPSRQQAEAMEPAFDALIARIRQDHFPGPTNRGDSRAQRINRLIDEALEPQRDSYAKAIAIGHSMPSCSNSDNRNDAVRRKCATGYSCGSSCISMSKQCRKTPSGGPSQQKMQRILALAAGKEGGPAVSGGARPRAASAAGGDGPASNEKPAGVKPMSIREMRSAVHKVFNVKSTAAMLANKNYQQSIIGDEPRTLKGNNAEEEWRQLYRRFVAVPRDERGLKDGGSVINGIDILKNFRPWVVFGLDPKTAKNADIDKAFRKLAMKHHPDAGGDRKVFEKLVLMKNSLKALRTDGMQQRLDALRACCEAVNG